MVGLGDELLELAAAYQRARVGGGAPLHTAVRDRRARAAREFGELIQTRLALKGPLARVEADDDRAFTRTPRDLAGARRAGELFF